MELIDAITYLRENILDDVGGLGADWSSISDDDTSSFQLRWNNEELVSNINAAIELVYRRILPVKEDNSLFNITTTQGVSSYSLDSRILQIVGIRDTTTNKVLKRLDIEELWENDKFNTEEQTPSYYIPNYDTGSITFHKVPKEAVTYSLLVYRLPLVKQDWFENDLEIELRDEFIIPMLWGAAAICYEKDEANTADPNRSIYYLQKFNQEFPVTSAYSDVRKRRTSNRTVKYGGI